MQDAFQFKSGSKEIIESGTIIQFDKKPIEIAINDLKLILDFIDEKGSRDIKTISEKIDDRTLKLIFHNFNSPLGTGNTKPIQLGTLHNRPLFVNYRIYALKDSDKTIHYTFYLGGTE